jgi:hypothetical protein
MLLFYSSLPSSTVLLFVVFIFALVTLPGEAFLTAWSREISLPQRQVNCHLELNAPKVPSPPLRLEVPKHGSIVFLVAPLCLEKETEPNKKWMHPFYRLICVHFGVNKAKIVRVMASSRRLEINGNLGSQFGAWQKAASPLMKLFFDSALKL